jgi:hypothetical protein
MVRRERMVVDTSDWRTLRVLGDTLPMRGSVNGDDSVRLFLNGTEIPRFHHEYGWTISPDRETDPDPNITDRRRVLRFNAPVRLQYVTIEADYRTIQAHCQKCNGYGRTNDFTLSPKRSFVHIVEHDKLLQRVLKYLLTSNCEFYPSLTSSLKDAVTKKLGFSLTEEDIMSEVAMALNNLMRVQQSQKSVQDLTPQEILKGIEDLWVAESDSDPSKMSVHIQVSSYGKERPSPLSFTMKTSR